MEQPPLRFLCELDLRAEIQYLAQVYGRDADLEMSIHEADDVLVARLRAHNELAQRDMAELAIEMVECPLQLE